MPLTSDIFHDFPPAARSIKYLIIKRYRPSKRIAASSDRVGLKSIFSLETSLLCSTSPLPYLALGQPHLSLSLSLAFHRADCISDMCLDWEKCRVCSLSLVYFRGGGLMFLWTFFKGNSKRRFLFLLFLLFVRMNLVGRLVYCSTTLVFLQDRLYYVIWGNKYK